MVVVSAAAPFGCQAWPLVFYSLAVRIISATQPQLTTRQVRQGRSVEACFIQARYHSIYASDVPVEEGTRERSELHASTYQQDAGSAREGAQSFNLLSMWRLHSRKPLVWVALSLLGVLCLCGTAIGGALTGWAWKSAQNVLGVQDQKEGEGDETSENRRGGDSEPEQCADANDEQCSSSLKLSSAFGENAESYATGKLYEEYVKDHWRRYSVLDEPDIFGHYNLRVASDGGMTRVSELKVKYLKAAQVISAGLLNGLFVLLPDVFAITGLGPSMNYGKDDFLIIKWVAKWALSEKEFGVVTHWLHDDINMLLPALELLFAIYQAMAIFAFSSLAILVPRFVKEDGEMYRWSFASYVLWHCGPQLASCNALRMLYYVTPKIIVADGYMMINHAWQMISLRRGIRHYAHGCFSVVAFGISRFFALILGFDAFLVKFRLASSVFDNGKTDLLSALAAAAFLWQVIGIVNLDWFVRDRFSVFLFAGHNGKLTVDELALVEVWKSLLFRQMVECNGVWRGIVIMIAFDDYDMQFLAFDDDEDLIQEYVSHSLSPYQSTQIMSKQPSV